jgi:hypothetical protein
MVDYITKPVAYDQLENVIKKYLWIQMTIGYAYK